MVWCLARYFVKGEKSDIQEASLEVALLARKEDWLVEAQKRVTDNIHAVVSDGWVHLRAGRYTCIREWCDVEAVIAAQGDGLSESVLELDTVSQPKVSISLGDLGSSHSEISERCLNCV